MWQRIEIKLEGIDGFSTCLVFNNDDVRLSLGQNGRCGRDSRRVASMDLSKLGVYIVGGPEFVAKAIECKTEDGKWDGDRLLALGFDVLLNHFRENREAFSKMIKGVERDAFERGAAAAKSLIRKALGVTESVACYARDDLDDDAGHY